MLGDTIRILQWFTDGNIVVGKRPKRPIAVFCPAFVGEFIVSWIWVVFDAISRMRAEQVQPVTGRWLEQSFRGPIFLAHLVASDD